MSINFPLMTPTFTSWPRTIYGYVIRPFSLPVFPVFETFLYLPPLLTYTIGLHPALSMFPMSSLFPISTSHRFTYDVRSFGLAMLKCLRKPFTLNPPY